MFLGLPLGLVASSYILSTLLGILFSSILCTCPNQRNLCRLIVSVIVGFLTIAWISSLISSNFPSLYHILGPKFLYTFLSNMFNCFLSLFVSVVDLASLPDRRKKNFYTL
jgi:hypothetical protein